MRQDIFPHQTPVDWRKETWKKATSTRSKTGALFGIADYKVYVSKEGTGRGEGRVLDQRCNTLRGGEWGEMPLPCG